MWNSRWEAGATSAGEAWAPASRQDAAKVHATTDRLSEGIQDSAGVVLSFKSSRHLSRGCVATVGGVEISTWRAYFDEPFTERVRARKKVRERKGQRGKSKESPSPHFCWYLQRDF